MRLLILGLRNLCRLRCGTKHRPTRSHLWIAKALPCLRVTLPTQPVSRRGTFRLPSLNEILYERLEQVRGDSERKTETDIGCTAINEADRPEGRKDPFHNPRYAQIHRRRAPAADAVPLAPRARRSASTLLYVRTPSTFRAHTARERVEGLSDRTSPESKSSHHKRSFVQSPASKKVSRRSPRKSGALGIRAPAPPSSPSATKEPLCNIYELPGMPPRICLVR